MTAELFELMKACCSGKKPDAHVFTREDGTPVSDPREDWQAACVAAGLGKYVPARNASGEDYQKYVCLTPHDLRRSAVRGMDRANVPQSVAMRISGHRTAEVFRRYDITSDADLRAAARKLESKNGHKIRHSRRKPRRDALAVAAYVIEKNGGDDETRTRDLLP